MSDPQQYVADQIGQQASDVLGTPATGDELAQAAQATAGLGTTEVDVNALAAQIKAMQERIAQMEADAAKPSADALGGIVRTIQHFLSGHGDPKAIALGEDLAAAAESASSTGDRTYVGRAAERLDRHLSRNAPYPGENYHYNNARAFVSDLPDVIDQLPAPAAPASQAPARVVQGAVVG
jgi:hypothetical protein